MSRNQVGFTPLLSQQIALGNQPIDALTPDTLPGDAPTFAKQEYVLHFSKDDQLTQLRQEIEMGLNAV